METALDTLAGFDGVHALLARHAQVNPEGTAFAEGVETLTWSALLSRTQQVARALMACGIQPRDMVAVLSPPSLRYVECLFGTMAARACVVPLPVSASVETLRTILADSGARLLLIAQDSDPALVALARELHEGGVLRVVSIDGAHDGGDFARWLGDAPGDTVLPEPDPEDPFNVIYSSGTTGVPKGIVHLHGMRYRQAHRGGFGFSPASRLLLSTPMYSNTTITPLLGSVAHGGQCILMRKFDAAQYLSIASERRVTHTMLVPVQYQRLLAHPDFDRHDLSSLELSQSTGAPMSVALKREILARWPGRFVEVYGLTEGGVSCFLEARLHPDKLATVGIPVHGTEVFLIDDEGRRIPPPTAGTDGTDGAGIPQKTIGEVVGRSPFMMAGYHHRPEATEEIRWLDETGRVHHRTGDVGAFDADGFLTLLDRKKDVIISGGNNIYACDLEAVVARHPDVQEVAVIGVPSPQWGETPLALVVAKAGSVIDADQLRDWANTQLGKTQRLAAVEVRAELARSAIGKLSKKQLRAPYWPGTSSR